MRVSAWCPAVLLWALFAGAAAAQEPPPAALIDDLLDKRGIAYEEARAAILRRQDVLDVTRGTLEGAAYGASTWRRLVQAEALAMHVTHREEAEDLLQLEGVNSDHYQRRRIPSPSVALELKRLRHVAPLMIELFLKGMETYAWSSPAAAEAEAAALRRDLLIAVGQSGHAASVHFLIDVIEGGCACCESCDAAALALGETGALEALPSLLRLLDGARANGDVDGHTAAVAALGGIRHVEVWPHIEAGLTDANWRVRAASLRSAAGYGSRWYWQADPLEGARTRTVIGSSLLDVLSQEEDERVVAAALESLSIVATPELRDMLERGRAPPSSTVRSGALVEERFRDALDRVNRALARQQRDRGRPLR